MSASNPLNYDASYPGGHPGHGYPPPGNIGSNQVSTIFSLTWSSITLKDRLLLNTMDSMITMTIMSKIMREDSMTTKVDMTDIIKVKRMG